ncbi:toxin-antitoxin system YwqK family antitoxin [Tenacibaculum sp. M341]|uniref:toxin-antitoxin system YwqK family antitoxin n=1 Tax=Tenacibaculum sp. M341 TaxID=2530339 RepID=UPI001047A839|nr:hypothetical protein [Tenacibaculum sp. M341]TCI93629.1 hypothetical protein EYW44_04245 [Tenacibaculum sp. M341]
MTEELIEISNVNSQGKLDIIYHDGLELVWENSPLLVSWAGEGEYSWNYSLIKSISNSLMKDFKEFEKSISKKSLLDSKKDIEILLSYFVDGEYIVEKHIASESVAGRYTRFSDYSIELPKFRVNKCDELKIIDEFKQYFIKQSKNNNYLQTFLNNTTDVFPTLQDTIIGLNLNSEIDEVNVKQYEDDIKNSNYPYCLIFSCFAENEDSINCYCIGTIEVIMAYKNLGIKPRYVEIKKIDSTSSGLNDQVISKLNESLFNWQLNSIFNEYFNTPNEIKRILELKEHPFKQFIRQGKVNEYWPNGNLKSTGNYIDNKPYGIITKYFFNGQVESTYFYDNEGTRIRPVKLFFETGELRSEFIYKEGDEYGIDKLYRKDGSIQRIIYYLEGICYIMLNGKYYIRDGKSEIHFHDNGQEEHVYYFKDGHKIDWQKFDRNGKLIDEMNKSS